MARVKMRNRIIIILARITFAYAKGAKQQLARISFALDINGNKNI